MRTPRTPRTPSRVSRSHSEAPASSRHQRNPAKTLAAARERVGQEAVVAAVPAGTDDHRSAESEAVLQRDEGFRQRVARDVGTIGRERILFRRTEEMDVADAGAGGQMSRGVLGFESVCVTR